MALIELLTTPQKSNKGKIGISEERLAAILPTARQYISFWRDYPDIFIDFMTESGPKTSFNGLFYYQRVFVRAAIRHKYVYAVFPRASTAPMKKISIFFGQTSLIAGSLFPKFI